jgi:hypothetical protein
MFLIYNLAIRRVFMKSETRYEERELYMHISLGVLDYRIP